MDVFEDLVKILLPAIIVLYAVYLTVRTFLQKEFERKLLDVKTKNTDIVLPIRLQAYERMSLFLERITPNNLILRLNNSLLSAAEFHQVLVSEIREEFNHNLSQQVYMSDEAWEQIKSATEEIIALVNNAASQMPPAAKSMDLAKAIIESILRQESDPTGRALRFIKNEIRQSF